jgi:Ran GTPase-activating protein (RanGAP) involved in mRNA processing and transport
LVKFDVSGNNLRAEEGTVLAEALKDNHVITELNLSDNVLAEDSHEDTDMSGVIALSNAIPTIRALTKFDISDNLLQANGGKALAAGLKGNQAITELNIANNYLGVQDRADNSDLSGLIAISDAIPTMGALKSLNVSLNALCGIIGVRRIDEDDGDAFDASGWMALADAIGKHP